MDESNENIELENHEQIHIEDRHVLQRAEHKYFLTEPNLYSLSTDLNHDVLKEDLLKTICRRYVELAENFCVNKTPFLLAAAFVVYNNLKSILQTEHEKKFLGELYKLLF
ncbi:Hypothetical predicted protein [Paramuricea clavata]|uniref:Uncharacterized protein n=1 Tax=Paramuricea clavata TaxID=317549 RepID=A0A6S7GAN2_PARCT|nr:Hypothetical predicted protein [Paramuricea clavata]